MRKNIILNSKALPFVPRMDDEKKALAKDLALKFDIDSKKYIHQITPCKNKKKNLGEWENEILTIKDIENKNIKKEQENKILRFQTLQKENSHNKITKEKKQEKKNKKQQKFPFLKCIAQEIYFLKLKKFGLPEKKNIRYKALKDVNDNELTEKKNRRVSKIKKSLKKYQEHLFLYQNSITMLSLSETSKIFPQQPQKEQLDFFTVEEESEEEIKIKEETEEINKKEQNFKKIESETKEKKEEIIQEAQEETKTKPETYNINKQKIKEQIQKLKDIELKEEIHEKKDEEKEYKKSISESTKMDFNIFSHIYLNEKKTHLKAVEHPQRIYNAMKIRKWVDHLLNPEIDLMVMKLVNVLKYAEEIKKILFPKKWKKRIVAGFNEVKRTLESNLPYRSSKCIIFAINIQENPFSEGTDEIIEEILNIAQEKNVIVLHSCSRRKLGLAYTGKKGPKISIISIVNYQNFEKEFHELENLIKQKKNEYKNLITPELDK